MTPREERLVAALERAGATPACPYCSGYTADCEKCTCRREDGRLYTVVVPYAPPAFASEWHPATSTGPFATLQRGCFKSVGAAIDWARERLRGTPYSVRPIEELEGVEVDLVLYEAQAREDARFELLGHSGARCVATLEDALADEVYDDALAKLRELEAAGRARLRTLRLAAKEERARRNREA